MKTIRSFDDFLKSVNSLVSMVRNFEDDEFGRWEDANYGKASLDEDPPVEVVEIGDKIRNGTYDGTELEEFEIPISQLIATQKRIIDKKVESMRGNENGGIAVVKRVVAGDGIDHYVVDGHHRLAASVADGKKKVGCKVYRIES